MNRSRRHLLRSAAALAAQPALSAVAHPLALSLAGIGALASQHARAQGSNYRALVCLFMQGGNDSHNWVVPTSADEYAGYARARGDLAWPAGALLPIGNGGQAAGRSFGMPQELQPLRQWYASGHATIVANIGPLAQPLTLAEYHAGGRRPARLFSHNDQQSTWQSLSPEGARSGWGGRLGDVLASANAQPVFTAVSAAGNAVFLSGRSVVQFQVGSEGPANLQALGSGWTAGSSTVQSVLKNRLARLPADGLEQEYARVVQRAVAANASLGTALGQVSNLGLPTTTLPHRGGRTTLDQVSLAQQLRIVARLIMAAPRLGMQRQVFMVQMGGFDTHASQMRDQPGLMAQVAASADWFLNTMNNAGLLPNVTLFTASEFGRTLSNNGDGCDHGWGSHHFVAGGSTLGGRIHGRFPTVALRTDTDIGSGRLLPTTAVTQLAAALGSWMGASHSDLSDVLPSLNGFDRLTLTS